VSCFYLAQIRITDPVAYEKYLARVDAVVAAFGGEYLAVDDSAITLEGEWGPGRFVLIRFASEEALKQWYFSEEYQGIVGYRLVATESRAVVVREGGAV
jgi:uncharacterized protein (DUF1330 family)